MSLEVRTKRFGWFLGRSWRRPRRHQLQGDGGDARHPEAARPVHFHVPKYGNRASVGLWLDGPKLDWHAVELALKVAYEKTAPKKLLQS